MKFVDGFGQRRLFCRSCGRSFLEHMPSNHVLPSGQRNVLGFEVGIYYRPGVVSFK